MKIQILSGVLLAGIVVACAPIDRATVVVDTSPPVVYRSAPSVYVAPLYPRSYYYGTPYSHSYRYGAPLVRHHRGFYYR
jgi:hypothetical protein